MPAAQATGSNDDDDILITPACVERIHHVNKTKNYDPPKRLRVEIASGGCSGFVYKLSFDNALEEDDVLFERDGAQVVVDETSLELIRGSKLDYVKELVGSSFAIVDNPQAETGCGCGTSFMRKGDV
ncbi:uncharacterized protein MONBRDRAFT_22682 [Monosiga brevicollis MX1]|uniref:Core domain-containing protein n=1 Tax=Monosiga brevicollis TaxID=81824 RepID=A9URR8_MONBE|nr:uncharacterized protein MONBRDRAFT_22682 [Monosiga brevicollis MX1]EDQ91974.1 predicted protein [Monosiga brevicollis MX1]|eukprot:XP_001743260.1 hypothetical protein [Monosiga brevicollis MX1]